MASRPMGAKGGRAPQKRPDGTAAGGRRGRGVWLAAAAAVAAVGVATLSWVVGGHSADGGSDEPCSVKVLGPTGSRLLNTFSNASAFDTAAAGSYVFYDATGTRVGSGTRACELGRVYRYSRRKGRHFVWPADADSIGHRFSVPGVDASPDGGQVELELLSVKPRIFRVHNFISESESDALINLSVDPSNQYRMRRSTTGTENWNQMDADKSVDPSRTSENAFVLDNPVSNSIFRRTFQLLRVPHKICQADGIQVVRYRGTQRYVSHYDYFDLDTRVAQGDFNFDPRRGGANRFATLFLYLSDVKLGGETVFPHANASLRPEPASQDLPQNANSFERTCRDGFAVAPRKLSAILFYNQDARGRLDSASLHGGCPVHGGGEKWAANVWVWNACRYGVPDI